MRSATTFVVGISCLVFLVLAGCGPSYQEALEICNQEIQLLERLEKERAALNLHYEEAFERIVKEPIAQQRKTLIEVSDLLGPKGIAKEEERIDKFSKEVAILFEPITEQHLEQLEQIDSAISLQRKRVAETKKFRDKLMPES